MFDPRDGGVHMNQGNRRSSPSFELIINEMFSVKRVNIWNRIAYTKSSILGLQILVAFCCLHKNQQKPRTHWASRHLDKGLERSHVSKKKVCSSFLGFYSSRSTKTEGIKALGFRLWKDWKVEATKQRRCEVRAQWQRGSVYRMLIAMKKLTPVFKICWSIE